MGETKIARFLSSLATDGHVSASTQNQAFNALLFLYQEILHKQIGLIDGVVPKRPRRLPVVLTKDEVKKVIEHMNGVPRLMAFLLYGAGLRLMECCRLRIKDIDFARNEIVVRAGNGDKDRHTMLPTAIKEALFNTSRRIEANTRNISKKDSVALLCRMLWNGNIPMLDKSGGGNGFFRLLNITQIG